jgi:Ca2+:H+ antiporter
MLCSDPHFHRKTWNDAILTRSASAEAVQRRPFNAPFVRAEAENAALACSPSTTLRREMVRDRGFESLTPYVFRSRTHRLHRGGGLDMLARMSGKAQPTDQAKSAHHFGDVIRSEFALLVGLGTAAIFFGTGSRLVEIIGHPVVLTVVFLWLFIVILWSAMSVVRHADSLAIKFGEPYGTLILTLSAITIEVVMISVAMLHGANNPTLARDAMFAVVMIALNGLVGLCLLLGGLRHREQRYNLQGVNSYLNVIMTLAVLGLVLPNFTTSTSGPTLSVLQGLFLAVMAGVLYGIFLLIQTMRHSQYFMESRDIEAAAKFGHHQLEVRSTGFHAVMLLLYLFAVVLLAEKFAIPLDNSIERFGMPQAFGGAIIAALVLAPEGLGAIEATLRNQLQRSVNILLGSVLATIGLTIPAVLTIGLITKRSVTLGVQGGNLPLLLLTLAVSVVTFTSGKTNVLQGCVHLLLFAVFVLLIFAP